MRPPDAPTLLWIATAREADVRAQASIGGEVRRVALGPLAAEEARTLAGALAERAALPETVNAEALAAEAGGHPLFIDELVRHASMPGARASGVRLEDALRARIERLDLVQRRLLDIVVVAGAPLAQDTARRALDCEFAEFGKHVAVLRIANFVRTGTARVTIEPYHDRVRDAVWANLAAELRRICHERLAFALEAANPIDPQSLALHW